MIKYTPGYKYQLRRNYTVATGIFPNRAVKLDFIELSLDGQIIIKKGYAWDGPSGPTVDTNSFMRGSLVHDALYQLMRNAYLPGGNSETRHRVDKLLRQHCLEDGMTRIRAWWVYKAVHKFARESSTAHDIKPVITAP
jgi:hypothetical protein